MTDEPAVDKKFFTKEGAAEYDNEFTFELGRAIAANLVSVGAQMASSTSQNPSIWSKQTRVLDFACGTGIVSQNIAPHAGQVVGVDISDGMLDIFDYKRVHAPGAPQNASGHLVNIFYQDDIDAKAGDIPGGLDGFDVVVSSLAYHHIDDGDEASNAIYGRLKQGGWAFIADIAKDVHPANIPAFPIRTDVVSHPAGFTLDELTSSFTRAGFKNVQGQSVTVELWASKAYMEKFGKNHIVSRDDDEVGKTYPQISGIRYYDQKTLENGEERYLIRKKLHIVGGQR